MRDISRSIYELLAELDDICKENGIEYCLEGNIVRDAYFSGNINSGVYEANISMDAKNIRKLYKVIETFSKENRCFECATNTRRKRDFVIRYLNTDTFFIDLMHPNRCINKCIRINIHLRVNNYDNPAASKAKKLQIAWRCGANNLLVLRNNFLSCVMMKLKRIFFGELTVGKKVVNKWIAYNDKPIDYAAFDEFLKTQGLDRKELLDFMKRALEEKRESEDDLAMNELSDYEKYAIIRAELPILSVNGVEIPAFFYDDIVYADINGRKFPIVKETELYLWFSLGVKDGFNVAEDEGENVIASEILSYKEMEKKYKAYFDQNKKLDRFLKREKLIRGLIRRPIRRMFDEFERVFFTERGMESSKNSGDL